MTKKHEEHQEHHDREHGIPRELVELLAHIGKRIEHMTNQMALLVSAVHKLIDLAKGSPSNDAAITDLLGDVNATLANAGGGGPESVRGVIGSSVSGPSPGTFVLALAVPGDSVNFTAGQKLASQTAASPPVVDAGFAVVTEVSNGSIAVDAQGSGWTPGVGRNLVIDTRVSPVIRRRA